ncbi:MAG: 5-formyltetrahydrofolate cyclo-ligase [Desulfurivibrio sp.]|nr:5-formyltetrahydrofolate cyclo-ligase [Desulfurivibrio sp.]
MAARDRLSPASRQSKSRAIQTALGNLEVVVRARWLLVYLHFRSEVETLPALAAQLPPRCRFAAPRTLTASRQLRLYELADPRQPAVKSGYCGIPEPDPAHCLPVDPRALDVVLVPGSVFDRRGGRLGYGGGYYDRFLAAEAPQALRIGLAFALQVEEKPLALAPHDQLLDYLVTEEEVLSFV